MRKPRIPTSLGEKCAETMIGIGLFTLFGKVPIRLQSIVRRFARIVVIESSYLDTMFEAVELERERKKSKSA
jgi:hypothetical protein